MITREDMEKQVSDATLDLAKVIKEHIVRTELGAGLTEQGMEKVFAASGKATLDEYKRSALACQNITTAFELAIGEFIAENNILRNERECAYVDSGLEYNDFLQGKLYGTGEYVIHEDALDILQNGRGQLPKDQQAISEYLQSKFQTLF